MYVIYKCFVLLIGCSELGHVAVHVYLNCRLTSKCSEHSQGKTHPVYLASLFFCRTSFCCMLLILNSDLETLCLRCYLPNSIKFDILCIDV